MVILKFFLNKSKIIKLKFFKEKSKFFYKIKDFIEKNCSLKNTLFWTHIEAGGGFWDVPAPENIFVLIWKKWSNYFTKFLHFCANICFLIKIYFILLHGKTNYSKRETFYNVEITFLKHDRSNCEFDWSFCLFLHIHILKTRKTVFLTIVEIKI